MPYHVTTIRQDVVPHGKIMAYWLCGYGFMLKFHTGQIVCIDPYLSDCVERIAGFRRLSLAPLLADQVQTDIYLITHDHPDHLDIDSFDIISAKNPCCMIIAGKSCEAFLKTKKVSYTLVKAGDIIQCGKLVLSAIGADHGDLCTDAIGFFIECEGRSIYFTGDTSLNESMMAMAINRKPAILVPCINPKFGNLGETDSAQLAKKCDAKIALPSHFGLFSEHGGDVSFFCEQINLISPNTHVVVLTPGRGELL